MRWTILFLAAACGGEDEIGEASADARAPSLAGKRFTIFYQFSPDVLEVYADEETGLPRSPENLHIFSFSHPSGKAASSVTAARVHDARDDFAYAPAFDLNDHDGWRTASTAQLRAWAYAFRDDAIASGADFFALNEAPTTTAEDAVARNQMARLLRYLAEPDATGASLSGILFLTHKPSMPDNWTTPASSFWKAVDDTCVAVIAEHYHSHGFICRTPIDALSDHFMGMREWLIDSGEPSKVRIANEKLVVLHSARYGPGVTGWQGADSNTVSLASFQRNLSRATLATRTRAGGFNRISYAPVQTATTLPGVHPRIAILARWHYAGEADPSELRCAAGADVNCRCAN
jgi:hypothetical protein